MPEHQQKNLAVYMLCVLLAALTVFQIYVSENNTTQQIQDRKFLEENSEQSKDVGQYKVTGGQTDSKVQCFEEMEILNDRLSLLEQLNFDKLGPTDYAARVFGGEVVSVVPTSRHRGSLLSRVRTAFSSMYDNYYQMQCIIQDCGTCFALEGSSGSIVIKLVKSVALNAITIEHIPKSALPVRTDVYSALKEFSVWGINNPESTGKEIYFGTYTFDYMTTFLETFELDLDQPVSGVRFVRVDIHSNHGEKFTCIYRIRVHGTPEE
ncbi:SUN domain-containing protein 3 [Anopheles arabiensis]|uniref:SUN domain-containing protein n=1 Tax=Anopheles arabiensis TaxID=7173 RepID=A0A182IB97_ANOAR|nr:SUN domain-containing protein 3 [Anopheles arabiensis]